MIRFNVKPRDPISFRLAGSGAIGMSVAKAKEVLVGGTGEIYAGPYSVEPAFREQILATKNKTLYNDVTVNAIRVERVSNTHGTTVYIGTKGD